MKESRYIMSLYKLTRWCIHQLVIDKVIQITGAILVAIDFCIINIIFFERPCTLVLSLWYLVN